MESYTPPIAPPERAPDSEPQKKKLRRVFELFKKPEVIPDHLPLTPETTAEHTPPTPERRRRLAVEIMSIMRGEKQAPTAALFSPEQSPLSTIPGAEKVVQYVATPESLPQSLPIVERAKDMGRSVLRLIKRVQGEVQTADVRDTAVTPTSIESLAEADVDVRAAMQELIAPIEAYEVRSDGKAPFPEALLTSPSYAELQDHDVAFEAEAIPVEARSPFARTMEIATAIATGTAREVLGVKERLEKRTLTMQKVGLFALGAATVGGFVYIWKRMRDLKKEQRHMRREHKKFEAEVRVTQQQEERQIHRLERTKIQKLSQPERQEYVEKVSEFAHQQATEIRTVARSQELLRVTAVAAVVERPRSRPQRNKVTPELQFISPPEKHSTFSLPIERPQSERPARTPECPTPKAKQAELVERLSGIVGARHNNQAGSTAGGGIMAAGARLVDAITGKQSDSRQQPSSNQPLIAPKKQMQGWPLVAAFCVAIILFILSVTGAI